MKKSSFVALIMGTVSGVLFALGMCMALLPEWNAFTPGIILGGMGVVLSIITVLVWCRMENKKLPKMSGKNVFRRRLRRCRRNGVWRWYVHVPCMGENHLGHARRSAGHYHADCARSHD